jgi:hypothetical protein
MERIGYIKYSASPNFGWREVDGKAICGGGEGGGKGSMS